MLRCDIFSEPICALPRCACSPQRTAERPMTHHRPSKKTHPSAPHARSAAPKRIQNISDSKGWLAPALLGTAAALGAAALYTAKKTREPELNHPPVGRFLDVDGVRLHYI